MEVKRQMQPNTSQSAGGCLVARVFDFCFPSSFLFGSNTGVLQHGVSVFSDGRAVDVRFSQGGETYL